MFHRSKLPEWFNTWFRDSGGHSSADKCSQQICTDFEFRHRQPVQQSAKRIDKNRIRFTGKDTDLRECM